MTRIRWNAMLASITLATAMTVGQTGQLALWPPAPAAAQMPQPPQMQFRVHPVIDQQHGGLVAGTVTVPAHWKVFSRLEWSYGDVSNPVRSMIRAEAPDGSAWVEYFPVEMFFWLEPRPAFVAVGARSGGMIHAPHVRLQDAMQHFVIAPYRGRMPNLQAVSSRPVHGLLEAFRLPPSPGEGMAVRLRYMTGGRMAEEDVYGMLSTVNRISYTGTQGTSYENQRSLVLAHGVGATDGRLDSMYPLLGFVATSLRVDPAWDAHRQHVLRLLAAEFNRLMAQGYERIQAAGQMSRTISANNDAILSNMQAQRQAQTQRDAARRAASAQSGGGGDEFSQYIRGTQRMNDPYWGQSEQSNQQRYHWTDGSGNYRSSNDASFNPNIGGGGGPNWQRMDPAR
jgi:hypothetical protein